MTYARSMVRSALDTAGVLSGAALLLLLGGVSILWCMKSLEIGSSEYEGYVEAHGGIERGWLPT